jgi:signal transduction histidine kinase
MTTMSWPGINESAQKERHVAEKPPVMQAHVLIVDDDPHARLILGTHIRYLGCTVLEAQSAQQALELVFGADDQPPVQVDLIITDVWMPGMSGIDLLKAVHAGNPDIPIAMVSARATLNSSLEAINLGAYAYLTKPFRAEEIQNVVTRGWQKVEETHLRTRLTQYSQTLSTLEGQLKELRGGTQLVSQEVLTDLIVGLRHELGNMTTALKLNLEVIKERSSIPADLHENLDDLQASVDDLTSLLARFKEYPEPGKITRLIDLRQVVVAAVDAAQDKEALSRDRVVLTLRDEPINIFGAAPELSRAFLHLLENALEAVGQTSGQTTGQVCVSATTQDDMALLIIEDEGPGFTDDILEHPFSPGNTTKVESGFVRGLGMGLFITRMVISLHGGHIRLENRPEGGARVSVYLPLATAESTSAA